MLALCKQYAKIFAKNCYYFAKQKYNKNATKWGVFAWLFVEYMFLKARKIGIVYKIHGFAFITKKLWLDLRKI